MTQTPDQITAETANYIATTSNEEPFDLEKLMDAIQQLKSLPAPKIMMCKPESMFSKMGMDFKQSEFMPENTAFIVQENKIVQMWKLEGNEVTAYEFKEPLSLNYYGIQREVMR